MGGRGTFANGNNVAYTYETVGKIDEIKILKGIQEKHGLPEESHTSSAYMALNNDNSIRQIRLYNSNLTAKTDIEFSVHRGRITLHAHDYKNGIRLSARELTKEENRIYFKFFGGIKWNQ